MTRPNIASMPAPAFELMQRNTRRHADQIPVQDTAFFQRHGTPAGFAKGSVLVKEGAPVRGVYLVVQGKIKIYRDLMPGQRQIFHFLRPGNLLGASQVILDESFAFQAEALEACETIYVPAELFLQHLHQSASFAQYLLQLQSREFAAWTQAYALVARRSVRVKLAVSLLHLHDFYHIPGNPTAVIHLSRTDLADYAGITLETTVRVLRDFKDSGLIHIRGRRILLLDIPALQQIAQETKGKKAEA